jgi:hypothetical protein
MGLKEKAIIARARPLNIPGKCQSDHSSNSNASVLSKLADKHDAMLNTNERRSQRFSSIDRNMSDRNMSKINWELPKGFIGQLQIGAIWIRSG